MNWLWRKTKKMEFMVLPEWEKKGAIAVFSSRKGGHSKGAYDSLNLAYHVDDDPERVTKNRQSFIKAAGGDLNCAVCCEQVHGSKVVSVDEGMKGLGGSRYRNAISACDGMVCEQPGIYLMTFYADCFPIYFFDPHKKVIGLAHSGWKGTYDEIGVKMAELMITRHGCQIDNIEVFIGPGIQRCCFEIKDDLAKKAEEKFPDLKIIETNKQGKLIWDLPLTIISSLQKTGIKKEFIYQCGLCTACDESLFFSYSRDGGITGRMGAAFALTL